MKPRLLDLFCGAGGAAMGYHRAGFEVVGVDIKPQPHYPFEFHQADALTFPLDGFDAIHASPPCQPFSRAGHLMRAQGGSTSEPDLVEPTRRRLVASGLPWVMENVKGSPLLNPLELCGSTFGLRVRRHRLFESSAWIAAAGPCRHREQGKPVGVYGSMGDRIKGVDRATGRQVTGGHTATSVSDAQDAMGIDWMPRWSELKLAIPPVMTEHIGRQLIAAIDAERVA